MYCACALRNVGHIMDWEQQKPDNEASPAVTMKSTDLIQETMTDADADKSLALKCKMISLGVTQFESNVFNNETSSDAATQSKKSHSNPSVHKETTKFHETLEAPSNDLKIPDGTADEIPEQSKQSDNTLSDDSTEVVKQTTSGSPSHQESTRSDCISDTVEQAQATTENSSSRPENSTGTCSEGSSDVVEQVTLGSSSHPESSTFLDGNLDIVKQAQSEDSSSHPESINRLDGTSDILEQALSEDSSSRPENSTRLDANSDIVKQALSENSSSHQESNTRLYGNLDDEQAMSEDSSSRPESSQSQTHTSSLSPVNGHLSDIGNDDVVEPQTETMLVPKDCQRTDSVNSDESSHSADNKTVSVNRADSAHAERSSSSPEKDKSVEEEPVLDVEPTSESQDIDKNETTKTNPEVQHAEVIETTSESCDVIISDSKNNTSSTTSIENQDSTPSEKQCDNQNDVIQGDERSDQTDVQPSDVMEADDVNEHELTQEDGIQCSDDDDALLLEPMDTSASQDSTGIIISEPHTIAHSEMEIEEECPSEIVSIDQPSQDTSATKQSPCEKVSEASESESKEPVSTSEIKEPVSQAEIKEPFSQADSKEPFSQAESKEPLSQAESKEPLSQTDSKEPLSQAVSKETLSQANSKEPFSQAESKEPLPQAESKEPLSQAESKEPLSQAESQEPLSQAESKEPLSQAESKEPFSQAESKEPLSQAESKEPFSQADSKEPLFQAESQEPLSQAESKEPFSQTESKDPLSQAESKEPFSQADSKEPLSQAESSENAMVAAEAPTEMTSMGDAPENKLSLGSSDKTLTNDISSSGDNGGNIEKSTVEKGTVQVSETKEDKSLELECASVDEISSEPSDSKNADETPESISDSSVKLIACDTDIDQSKIKAKHDVKSVVSNVNNDTENSKNDEDMDDIILIDDEISSTGCNKESKSSFKDILKSPTEFFSGTKLRKTESENVLPEQNIKPQQTASQEKESEDRDRKRSLTTDSENDEGAAKRSRLDEVVNGQGDHASSEKSAGPSTQDCEMDDDVMVDEQKENIIKTRPTGLCVQVSSQALQNFVTACVRGFLRKHKQDYMDRLTQQARSMESASSLWKHTAKYLEKSVQDLNAHKQRMEKKKAELAAAKRLASKSVGVQVSDNKPRQTAAINNVPQPQSKSAANAPAMSSPSAMLSLPPSARLSNQYYQPAIPQPTIVRPQIVAPPSRHQGPGPRPTTPARGPRPQMSSASPARPMYNARLPTQASTSANNAVNMIDLTDEEDMANKQSPRQVYSSPRTEPPPYNRVVNGYGQPQGHQGFIPKPRLPVHPPGGMMQSQSEASHRLVNGIPVYSPLIQQSVRPGKPPTHSLPPSVHINKHPAPLPRAPIPPSLPARAKKIPPPPQPGLKISRVAQGIVLSWNMPTQDNIDMISSYQLFAYQETDSVLPNSSLWKKVGDVKALPLPMACTLTQFQEGNKYHFAVRANDRFGRSGWFSEPSSIFLGPK